MKMWKTIFPVATGFLSLAALAQVERYSSVNRTDGNRQISPTPTQDMLFKVENYSSGYCSVVSLAGDPQRLVDSCHGWRMFNCIGKVLIVSDEARLARANVVISENGSREILDVNQQVSRALERGLNRTVDLISLRYGDERCIENASTVQFEGSYLLSGRSGPSTAFSGIVRIRFEGVSVTISR